MCGAWRGYDVTGIEGGEFTLQLIPYQKVASLYWRSDMRTHKQKLDPKDFTYNSLKCEVEKNVRVKIENLKYNSC
jgi:hypothetical protein